MAIPLNQYVQLFKQSVLLGMEFNEASNSLWFPALCMMCQQLVGQFMYFSMQ